MSPKTPNGPVRGLGATGLLRREELPSAQGEDEQVEKSIIQALSPIKLGSVRL